MEQRPIDGEKLKNEVASTFHGALGITVTGAVHEIIDRQPTIDPESLRPSGKWKDGGYVVWCLNCGEPYLPACKGYKYCPNCGAKMEEP